MSFSQPVLIKTPCITVEKLILSMNQEMHRNSATTSVIYVDSGRVFIVIRCTTYSLSHGETMIIPQMEYRLISADNERGACLDVLELSDFQYTGMGSDQWPFLENEALVQDSVSIESIGNTIKQITMEYHDKQFGFEQSLVRLTEYLLILLQRFFTRHMEETMDPRPLLTEIKSYIDKNYDKNLTLNGLSEVFYASPFHISHLFKNEYAISPIQYLIHARIKAASELLIHTSLTVSEISNAVGYSNVNYFHILFKRFTGLSPGKFRTTGRKKHNKL